MDLDIIINLLPRIIAFASMAVSVILAISLHEWAHAWMANRLGDPTARMLGRMSINPLRHIDPIGTVLMPIGLLVVSLLTMGVPFTMGYAKPVPFNPRYLKNPKRDTALVGIAGPAINVILATGAGFILLLLTLLMPSAVFTYGDQSASFITGLTPFGIALGFFAYINLLLCFFNLIPIPPLDGSRIVQKFLKGNVRQWYASLERYGMFIVIALVFFVPMVIEVNLIGLYFRFTLWPVFEFLTRIPVSVLFHSMSL
ncbi:MAG: site-2 protease family protein [Coriobacteriia bacterium]|nr:site-2 protease family protein [Coriobacteriia bacterium]